MDRAGEGGEKIRQSPLFKNLNYFYHISQDSISTENSTWRCKAREMQHQENQHKAQFSTVGLRVN